MPGKPHFVKYKLHFQMHIDGFVERNDIVGAIFGQLEGVLPPELDPQNLLNTGRIGRIEVSLTHREGKTYAEIIIPCSLNKVEASILAAAVETINKIGPASAETRLDHIENVLEERRKQIIDRASEILGGWYNYEKTEVRPESIPRLIEEKARKTKMVTVGPEKLPAGVGVLKSDDIIIVEGRADVINLIKHGYDNVIAVGGSGTIPKTVVDLAKKKTTTAFVDGDRAGILLLKSLLQSVDLDYITIAPKGKEVEELSYKEIKYALDHRISIKNLSLDIDRLEYLIEEYLGKKSEKIAKPEDINMAIEAIMDKIASSKKFVAVNENFEEMISGSITLLDQIVDHLSGAYAVLVDFKPSNETIKKLKSVGVKILAYRGKNDKIEIINLQTNN